MAADDTAHSAVLSSVSPMLMWDCTPKSGHHQLQCKTGDAIHCAVLISTLKELCSFLGGYQHFRDACHLHHHSRREHGGSGLLQNVGNHLKDLHSGIITRKATL
jgi:hypothetical protein